MAPDGPRPPEKGRKVSLGVAAKAYQTAWEKVPSLLQARILRHLQEEGEDWVQEAILAWRRPDR